MLPAPAPTRPPSDTYVEPVCSASFNWAVVSPGAPWSRRAAAPLTIGAAMLVPLSRM
jgi:hypothetical protein